VCGKDGGAVPVEIAGGFTVNVPPPPPPEGGATSAGQGLALAQLEAINTGLGAPADAPAASPTATAGIGPLLRLALQNQATLIQRAPVLFAGSVPTTALTDQQLRAAAVSTEPNIQRGGGAVTAATTRVTLATDGPGVAALTSLNDKIPALSSGRQPVEAHVPARTPTTTTISATTTSALAIAANLNRRGLLIQSEATGVARFSFANPATTTNHFMAIAPGRPGGFVGLDQQLIVTNAIYVICDVSGGSIQITELV
jgi:hypothetical protein